MKAQLLLVCLLAGCASHMTEKPHEPSAAAPLETQWTSTLIPRAAAQAIAETIHDYGFDGPEDHSGVFGNKTPIAQGDYFDQKIHATNMHDQTFDGEVEWVDADHCTIKLQSSLPKNRYDFVLGKVREAVVASQNGAR